MKTYLSAAVLMVGLALPTFGKTADLGPLAPAPQASENLDEWTFTIAPYFWGAGISGDTAQFGVPEVHIDADLGDLLQNLDFAFMAAGEARHGRFSIFGDIIYTKFGADGDTPSGILADSVDVTSTMFAGLLGVGYSVLEDQTGNLDVVAGVKVWSLDTELSFNGGILDGRDVDDSATWVDGVVGVRGNYFFTPEIYLTGWGLVGAGGADVDWDVALGLGYKFNDTISAIAGYRALGVDYDNDGFVFDVVQQGPILGVAIRF
ncbi:hypothetical protein [Rhizobium leguminosarum]|uniref:Outer membrane protein beta-barrel domain-containing protein n=1 Tax=Rhizobium leguminosarum TaxID=384 RepID=A0A2K9Z3B1_RHILE|nr:hypothetical protein [Rhizobium leguminosarum]AUW42670.1 conserved exported protein of unknown function [Rhizobium leguminosarum]